MGEEPIVDDASASPQVGVEFDALFVVEYPKMVALAAAIGGRGHAEDIAQEAMSRLFGRWPEISGYDKPGAWLRRVTINLAVSRRRRLMSEAKALLRLDRIEPTLPEYGEPDGAVWAAVASLPAKQRAAIALHYLEDRSVDEIAEVLDVAPATARVHLHRARRTLRQRLDEEALR